MYEMDKISRKVSPSLLLDNFMLKTKGKNQVSANSSAAATAAAREKLAKERLREKIVNGEGFSASTY